MAKVSTMSTKAMVQSVAASPLAGGNKPPVNPAMQAAFLAACK